MCYSSAYNNSKKITMKKLSINLLLAAILMFAITCSTNDRIDETFSEPLNLSEKKATESPSLNTRFGAFTPPLTPAGFTLLQQPAQERRRIANRLLDGFENINTYVTGGAICYEVAAFVRFLYDNQITCEDLTNFRTQGWLYRFNFTQGTQWNGNTAIAAGEIVGFQDESTQAFFHAAVGTGNYDEIRAVNGGTLGAGWMPIRLGVRLGSRNTDGTFNYEGRRIRVFIANFNAHTEL
jgi:hypothetical protein